MTAVQQEVVMGELGPIEVFAAGGVVWRLGKGGRLEVLLVHRPRYDDWSIPKGKRDSGETDEENALREVWEETGLSCRLGEEIAESEYIDRKERVKLVRYWAMTAIDPDAPFVPADEVDEVRWVSVRKARKLVSYAADAVVIDAFQATV